MKITFSGASNSAKPTTAHSAVVKYFVCFMVVSWIISKSSVVARSSKFELQRIVKARSYSLYYNFQFEQVIITFVKPWSFARLATKHTNAGIPFKLCSIWEVATFARQKKVRFLRNSKCNYFVFDKNHYRTKTACRVRAFGPVVEILNNWYLLRIFLEVFFLPCCSLLHRGRDWRLSPNLFYRLRHITRKNFICLFRSLMLIILWIYLTLRSNAATRAWRR